MFLVRSKLSFTLYLFLVFNRSTALQSQSFLKNIKSFLGKEKLVNNCNNPSTHADRKITVTSGKHSFTLYPSLSPYRWTDRQTDRQNDRGMNILTAHGLEKLFFQLCRCVSFLVVAGNSFR